MTLKEERTYNSLNEALLAGARFTHVGDNGEYVEYLAYESGKYSISRWVYRQCVATETFKSLSSILRYKKYEMWKNPEMGIIKQYYSFNEIREKLNDILYINNAKDEKAVRYILSFLKDKDDYSNYELTISKYFNTCNKYYIEVFEVRQFGFSKALFMRIAKDDDSYSKYCSDLIEVLKELKLDEGWYRNVGVRIENVEGL